LPAVIAGFVASIRSADMAAPVPTCPDWTVKDLAEHLGGIHRWVAHMVERLSPERVRGADIDLQQPDDPAALPDWLEAGGELLLAALNNADPDAPMWGWGSDLHARFWSRRMVHETGVHAIDALAALGAPLALPREQAIDGIDEFLDNLPCAAYFSPSVDELRGHGETLAFAPTDGPVRWRITLEPERFRWDHDDAPADATIAAPASDLLLAIYGRTASDGMLSGNETLTAHWLKHASI